MKKKNWLLIIMTISLVVFLVACDSTNKPITSESTGIWNEFFVYPLSWFLRKVASISFLNYGWAIIIVTIIVRFALLPLMIKQTRSTKAMQSLQPELNKLKEKYSSKDQATQAQLQKETMALFQSKGVNPVAGCLPLLIQMPVLIAFYHAIMRTPEIKTGVFLWFKLGHADPYYILPILAAATTFLQQKITMVGQEQVGTAAQQMKIMTYMMPVMILVMGITLPSALSLYWTIGNTFMMIQTFVMKYPDIKAAREKKAGSSRR